MAEILLHPPKMTSRVLHGGAEEGIAWCVVRAPLYGAANGYVQVPEGHPWHGKEYDELDVECPGGLTFARDGWIGFDTLHGCDYWPGQDLHICDSAGRKCTCTHWTDEMVVEEAKALARRVFEAAS